MKSIHDGRHRTRFVALQTSTTRAAVSESKNRHARHEWQIRIGSISRAVRRSNRRANKFHSLDKMAWAMQNEYRSRPRHGRTAGAHGAPSLAIFRYHASVRYKNGGKLSFVAGSSLGGGLPQRYQRLRVARKVLPTL